MNNMEYWAQLQTPPPDALRKIMGGRLKGKSDINPMWRMQRLTEVFGACGIGWKYEIVNLWLSEHGGETLAHAQINLYVRNGDDWSEAIPGVGGSKIVEQERNGAYVCDEAYKMALTDALGVAMKSLGMAADVYRGLYDSKYGSTAPQPKPTQRRAEPKPTHSEPTRLGPTGAPSCPKCGAYMEESRSAKIAWKCSESRWNRETKREDGCDGVIWQEKWDAHPEQYTGAAKSTASPARAQAKEAMGSLCDPATSEQLQQIGVLLAERDLSDEDAEKALKPFGGIENMTVAQANKAIEKLS